MNGVTEFIEVVNSRDAHLWSKFLAVMNQFGFAINTPGNTSLKTLYKDIKDKIDHGYKGTYYLVVSFDWDANPTSLINSLKNEFRDQRAFRRVYLYESGSKNIFEF